MKPERLLLATKNAGKVRELQALLAPIGVAVASVADIAAERQVGAPDVEETGATFLENATIKAKAYAAWAGLPAIADDSGLCVDALAGAPGVLSSRYAGRDGDDEANNRKLLQALAGVAPVDRTASFHAAVVYLAESRSEPVVAEAAWRGRILDAPRGEGGFGYDPLFWLDDHGCTSAELAAEVKNRLSHRGLAVRALVGMLERVWSR